MYVLIILMFIELIDGKDLDIVWEIIRNYVVVILIYKIFCK